MGQNSLARRDRPAFTDSARSASASLVRVRMDTFMVASARSRVPRDFDDTLRRVQQVHLGCGPANGSTGNSASKSSDSASLRRRASSWRSQKVHRRSRTQRAEAVEPPAGFGEVPLSRVGQGQVGPIGGVILELRLLRGGRSLVQAGDRLVDPAGPDEQPAQRVRKVVRAIDRGWHGNVGQPFLEPGDRDAVIVQALGRPGPGATPAWVASQATIGSGQWRARTAAQASR